MKRHIKILSSKFNHELGYEGDVLLLKNEVNNIKIWKVDKYGINISFNLENDLVKKSKLKSEDFYNVLIEVLERKDCSEKLMIGTGNLLTIEAWAEEEGDFAYNQLDTLKEDLKTKSIEYRYLGGNRFIAEFYKGVLILKDDFCWGKSNVISI